ncbi:MAG: hypothetical protein HC840_09335 [Leptolyngbyaceae cyanobacterium RM2_2_4]|nr:hypothetical protein [Leptolyngbyaceae cyanobacterium SM1_4_3]NJO49607.1 hypothetical protein [Leptolyngbyaceae cyanobacterium RM2_2_4]NJO73166.1 hypothetical protein [Leptolyngbyaceae cyanobacterium RM1_406_9]
MLKRILPLLLAFPCCLLAEKPASSAVIYDLIPNFPRFLSNTSESGDAFVQLIPYAVQYLPNPGLDSTLWLTLSDEFPNYTISPIILPPGLTLETDFKVKVHTVEPTASSINAVTGANIEIAIDEDKAPINPGYKLRWIQVINSTIPAQKPERIGQLYLDNINPQEERFLQDFTCRQYPFYPSGEAPEPGDTYTSVCDPDAPFNFVFQDTPTRPIQAIQAEPANGNFNWLGEVWLVEWDGDTTIAVHDGFKWGWRSFATHRVDLSTSGAGSFNSTDFWRFTHTRNGGTGEGRFVKEITIDLRPNFGYFDVSSQFPGYNFSPVLFDNFSGLTRGDIEFTYGRDPGSIEPDYITFKFAPGSFGLNDYFEFGVDIDKYNCVDCDVFASQIPRAAVTYLWEDGIIYTSPLVYDPLRYPNQSDYASWVETARVTRSEVVPEPSIIWALLTTTLGVSLYKKQKNS